MLRMELQIDAERLAAWEGLIRTVGDLLKTFDRELEDSEGIPLTWYDVLVQLNEAPGGRLRMQALADLVVLSRSGLTRLIDRMERVGLASREPSAEDRRGYYAILTDQGRRAFLAARPVHHRGIHDHFTRHLDDADIRALAIAVAKVRDGNRKAQTDSRNPGL